MKTRPMLLPNDGIFARDFRYEHLCLVLALRRVNVKQPGYTECWFLTHSQDGKERRKRDEEELVC